MISYVVLPKWCWALLELRGIQRAAAQIVLVKDLFSHGKGRSVVPACVVFVEPNGDDDPGADVSAALFVCGDSTRSITKKPGGCYPRREIRVNGSFLARHYFRVRRTMIIRRPPIYPPAWCTKDVL